MINTTYELSSITPEYIKANRKFIEQQSLQHTTRILDLACGNGTVSELLSQVAPHAYLHGLDRDPIQIELVTKRFENLGYEVRNSLKVGNDLVHGKPVMSFAVAAADEPPFPDETFDCVVIANAIHLMPDKEKLVAAVSRVIKPGGLFGFNSAFYAGTFPEGTHQFYVEWLSQATRAIQELSDRLQSQGQPPIRRIRDKSQKAFRNRWLSPAEWTELLERQHFNITNLNERVVMLDGDFFAAIGAYAGFAEVLLSGYPVDIAASALQTTAHPALATVGATAIPRNWLEVWAVKR
ncbi:MAG: class I SAM-dependent methyltransferase [Candidatus Competibacteraceae bacterium]